MSERTTSVAPGDWYAEPAQPSRRRKRPMDNDDFSDSEKDGAAFDDTDDDRDEDNDEDDVTAPDGKSMFTGNMLRYSSVSAVSTFLRTSELQSVFQSMNEFDSNFHSKNAIVADEDPEHNFVISCSKHCLKIEVEKTKVFKFLRDHYAVRFPELVMLTTDSVTYAKLVKLIQNDLDLTDKVDGLLKLLPSQLCAAVIAAASTTHGRELSVAEWDPIDEAIEELCGLEDAKQLLLEYIQSRMKLMAPNMSAFLGTALTSQIFALVGSVVGIANLDINQLMELGSGKGGGAVNEKTNKDKQQPSKKTGFKLNTGGFLLNVDLVKCHTPELRTKALRTVALKVLTLARLDSSRRASDNSSGLRAREDIKRHMASWTDPLVQQVQSRQRGLANRTYERRTRRSLTGSRRNEQGNEHDQYSGISVGYPNQRQHDKL